jgi:hypothetical protein
MEWKEPEFPLRPGMSTIRSRAPAMFNLSPRRGSDTIVQKTIVESRGKVDSIGRETQMGGKFLEWLGQWSLKVCRMVDIIGMSIG